MFETILLLLPLQVNAFNRDRTLNAYSSLLAISECWEIFKNIFKSVASISVKCVIMISCGDSASVGLSFYLFSFLFCKYLF